MPYNVCDINGRHIGYISDSYPEQRDVLLIAVTETCLEDENVDMEDIVEQLASIYGCKGLLGKINEEKLGSALVKQREQDDKLRDLAYEDLVKHLFLKKNTSIAKAIKADSADIKGYLLLDADNLRLQDGLIVIDEELDYTDWEEMEEETQDTYITYSSTEKNMRIFGRIENYPVVKTEVMGVGEGLLLGANFSDFGGRNHSHRTKLKIKSGNCLRNFELPFIINAKKGMAIIIYLEGKKIKKVFCDGVFYEL